MTILVNSLFFGLAFVAIGDEQRLTRHGKPEYNAVID